MTSWRYITPSGVCSALCVWTSKSVALQVKGMAEYRVRGVWAPRYILDREKDSWLLAWLSAGRGGSHEAQEVLYKYFRKACPPCPNELPRGPTSWSSWPCTTWGQASVQGPLRSMKHSGHSCFQMETFHVYHSLHIWAGLDRSFAPAAWCIGTELWLLY